MFLVRAAGVGRHFDGFVHGFYEIVGEQVVFDLFAGDVGEHDAVDLDAGGKGLTGLGDHLGVVVAVVDDVDVLKREAVLAHDGAHAV